MPLKLTYRRILAGFTLLAVVIVAALAWNASRSSRAVTDIGGPFHLVDQTGAQVDERILRGKWSAVFFGYTYCPDVCPTTLSNLGQASLNLGNLADRFQVVFITVDPERDTAPVLRSYLASPSFPKGSRGLTGSPAQIAAAARAYHVYFQRVREGGTYTMDHSAVVYLMDPEGRFVRPLDVQSPPPELARRIRDAMDAG
jgi:protein SCO1/2